MTADFPKHLDQCPPGPGRRARFHRRATTCRAPIRLASLLAWLFLGITPAAAQPSPSDQTIPVRSGEHGDFTRLVIELPENTEWDLGATPQGYELRLDAPGAAFDISTVFDRIPRDRITAITATIAPPRLLLTVPCDCDASAFIHDPGYLVIDIRAPAAAQFVALGPPPIRMQPSATASPQAPSDDPHSADTTQLSRTSGYDWTGQLFPEAAVPQPAEIELQTNPADKGAVSHAQAARDTLIMQFARAASQGLVQIEGRAPGQEPPAAAANPQTPRIDATGTGGDVAREASGATGHLTLIAETAMDAAARMALMPLAPADPYACPETALFDVPAWGSDAPASAQLAAARAPLIGEFDNPDEAAVIALARLYVFFGFGAEAIAVLDAFPGEAEQRQSLRAIADLIDDETSGDGRFLTGKTQCPGPEALWGLIAAPVEAIPGAIDEQGILRSFNALPAHLRHHLAARLVERFIATDRRDAAMSIRSIVARTPGNEVEQIALIGAILDLDSGRTAAAIRHLEPVAGGRSPHAPDALARMVETMIRSGESPAPATVETLSALAFEHRNSPLAERLERLEIMAFAAAGRFGEAFAAHDRHIVTGQQLESWQTERLFAFLTERSSDAALLHHLLTQDAWHTGKLPAQERQALARRVLELGLPDLARMALPPAPAAEGEDLLIHAQAALSQGNLRGAHDLLARQDDPRALRLRAEALTRLGEPSAALEIYLAAGTEDKVERELRHAAWIAGDAAAVARFGDDLQRASIANQPPGDASDTRPTEDIAGADGPSEADAPLTNARRLLEDSRENRALFEALLEAHEIPQARDAL